MSKSKEVLYKTTADYISAQPVERQEVLQKLKNIVSQHLPTGFEESTQYNMITFSIPLEKYPKGYLGNQSVPIPFISIANQKNYVAFYHMGMVASSALKNEFVDSYNALNIGKLDIGKSCIRFKKMDKIPYSLLAETCEKMSLDEYLTIYKKYKS